MPPNIRLGAVPYGVNVVGFVTGNLGLGVATRNTISLLKSAGVRVAATDLDPGSTGQGMTMRTRYCTELCPTERPS